MQAALHGVGLSISPDHVKMTRHGRGEARAAALEFLASPNPPTAVFAASDTQALGVIDAARLRGLRIPGDLSIVGCDDVQMSADIVLTTVDIGLYESGMRAAQFLLARLEDPMEQPSHITLGVELRIRATTGEFEGDDVPRVPRAPSRARFNK